MKITAARVIVTCPGRNFVTLKIETDEGITGIGDATLNGRELAVAIVPDRPRDPGADRPRPGANRGHLAVPLPRRVLAARTGDDERHRGRRHRAVGHQGQGREPAALRVARRREPRRRDGVRPRQRQRHRRDASTKSRAMSSSATRRSARNAAFPGLPSTYGVAKDKLYYEPADAAIPDRERLVDDALPRSRAEALRRDPRALRLRSSPAARRASSADADRGRPARPLARAVPVVLDGGPDAGRKPGRRSG